MKHSSFFSGVLLSTLFALSIGIAESRELPDFSDLAKKHGPSVVNISTTQKHVGIRSRFPKGFQIPDFPEGSPFNDFFKRFFGEEGEEQETETTSLGSGFIISKDGYIVTNHHVIKDADEIIIRLSNRREYTAEVVGSDARSDIALLKVDAKDLPVVRMGKSSDLKVGEWVLAIGSPFGFEHSVTAGIVSAKGRNLPRENYVPFIQTDVAINPGNSGGPLFNLDGEVVGVNAQIYSRTGGFMGLSFAIPIDVVSDVVKQLKTKGHVTRGWLGVLIQDVTRELADSFGMEKPRGALISKVLPDSPAAKAGFEVGDIIVDYNGTEIYHSSDLPPVVGRTSIGNKATVRILRKGKHKKIHATIAELPQDQDLKLAKKDGGKAVKANRLNVEVTDLTANQRKQFELDGDGVIVKKVQKGPAHKAGIRKGDIILMLNNHKITDVSHFEDIVKDLPDGQSIPVLVHRRGGPMFLALKVPD